MKNTIFIVAIVSALFASSVFAQQQPKLFKAGQNVVMVGDSITHGGFHTEAMVLFYATRYPDSPVKFHNAGMSGETSRRVLKRMDYDIFNRNPDVAVLMIGMNDVPRGAFSKVKPYNGDVAKFAEKCRSGHRECVDKILGKFAAKKVKTVVLTPSIFDQTLECKVDPLVGCNDELGKLGDIDAELAAKHGAISVDIWNYMTDMNALYQRADAKRSFIRLIDRVHPQELGGFVVMAKLVEDFGESRIVSKTVIDAKTKQVFAENAEVSNLKTTPSEVSFTLLEKALPFPSNAEIDGADEFLKFLHYWNLEILCVENLANGEWELLIDGKSICKYRNGYFRYNGINLAQNKNTPQYKQAQNVAKLVSKYRLAASSTRSKIYEVEYWKDLQKFQTNAEKFKRLREIIDSGSIKTPWGMRAAKAYPENKLKEAEMLADEQKILKEIYAAAMPKPHEFKLIKIK